MKPSKIEKFEHSLGRLEKLVEKLEEGNLPLEEALQAFEEGMGLAKVCEQKLHEAQKKIQLLMKDKEGKEQVVDFEEDE